MFSKKSRFKTFALLPIAKSLFEYLEMAIDHGLVYSDEHHICIDGKLMKTHIAEKVLDGMKNWTPIFNGIEVLDEETKEAGSRFLAGIAYSYLSKKAA